jgi:hypothetical protein
VHGATGDDLSQSLPGSFVEIPPNDSLGTDYVEQTPLVFFAFAAIFRVLSGELVYDLDRFQVNLLMSGIETHCYRSAGAESAQQQLIGVRSFIGTTDFERFVRNPGVPSGVDFGLGPLYQ